MVEGASIAGSVSGLRSDAERRSSRLDKVETQRRDSIDFRYARLNQQSILLGEIFDEFLRNPNKKSFKVFTKFYEEFGIHLNLMFEYSLDALSEDNLKEFMDLYYGSNFADLFRIINHVLDAKGFNNVESTRPSLPSEIVSAELVKTVSQLQEVAEVKDIEEVEGVTVFEDVCSGLGEYVKEIKTFCKGLN